MLWVPLETTLPGHPKTKRVAEALAAKRRRPRRVDFEAMGRIAALWVWVIQYAPDGDVTNVPAATLAEASGLPPSMGEWWVETLLAAGGKKAGFLERDGERLLVHDWDERGGRIEVKREVDRKRKRQERKTGKVNSWKLWIDAHRAKGLPDPLPQGPDLKAGKALGEMVAGEDEMAALMRMYLEDTDRFVAAEGHPLRKLGGRVQGYRIKLQKGGKGKGSGKYDEVDDDGTE